MTQTATIPLTNNLAQAEANAIRVKLEAQARGEAAIIEERAEALGKLIERAGGAREAFLLLEPKATAATVKQLRAHVTVLRRSL